MMINKENSFGYILKNGLFFSLYGAVKYLPPPVGDVFRYLVLKPFLKKIRTVWIKDGATFWFPDRISIGRNVSINEFVVINGAGTVTIGDDVMIGHGTSIVSDSHGFEDLSAPIYTQKKTKAPIRIGNNVLFGCNVTVLPGVTIGSGAIIGAGTLVARDVPEDAVICAMPGRVVRKRGGDHGPEPV